MSINNSLLNREVLLPPLRMVDENGQQVDGSISDVHGHDGATGYSPRHDHGHGQTGVDGDADGDSPEGSSEGSAQSEDERQLGELGKGMLK